MRTTAIAKSVFGGALCGAILCAGASVAVAGGKLSVDKQVTVNASPETTWKMVGHYNHVDVWHPAVVMSSVTGDAREPGAVRVLTLADGAKFTEVLLRHSDRDLSYTYEITDSPLPIADYEATLSVRAAPGGKAMITWASTFDPKGVSDEQAIEAVSGVYEAGLAHVARHFQ